MFLKPNDHFDHKSMIALPSGLQKWVDIIVAYAKEKLQIKTAKAEDQLRLRQGFILVALPCQPIRGELWRANEKPWKSHISVVSMQSKTIYFVPCNHGKNINTFICAETPYRLFAYSKNNLANFENVFPKAFFGSFWEHNGMLHNSIKIDPCRPQLTEGFLDRGRRNPSRCPLDEPIWANFWGMS